MFAPRTPTVLQADSRRRWQRAAFTLVELLVVIAVIALLVSILTPSLQHARELARRASCGANLHGTALAYQVYANDHETRLPLFFHNSKQQNHWIWYGGASGSSTYKPHWFWQGLLYTGGSLDGPRVLYCPSNRIERHAFNSPSNPWPVQDFTSTVSTYGNRPVACKQASWSWTTAWERAPKRLRLPEMLDKAMIGDYFGLPVYVDQRHADGINMAYTDGAVHWLDRSVFDGILSGYTTIQWDYGNYNWGGSAKDFDDMWKDIDDRF